MLTGGQDQSKVGASAAQGVATPRTVRSRP